MAEQLGLEQGFGDVGAVDLDEGVVTARRVEVDRAGEKALARAGVAGEQDGGVGRGEFAQALENGLEIFALRDDLVEVVDNVLLAAQVGELVDHLPAFHGLLHRQLEACRTQGVDEEIAGAGAQRLDDEFGPFCFAGGDERRGLALLVDFFQQGEGAVVFLLDAQEDEIELLANQGLLQRFGVALKGEFGGVSQGQFNVFPAFRLPLVDQDTEFRFVHGLSSAR